MKTGTLGATGISIPKLVFGGNVFGWTADKAQSFRLLDAALDHGLHMIDTADMYSAWAPGNQGGESETIIGEWIASRNNRHKLIIATKVGMAMGTGEKGLSPAWIKSEIEASLGRLQTDYVDLYQAHADDDSVPLLDSLTTFNDLVTSGKVRAIGASNYSAARFAEALQVSRSNGLAAYQTIQPQYNLVERAAYESELEALVLAENIGVIPYYALASGFLTGKYRSAADAEGRARENGVRKYMNSKGEQVLKALDDVAAQLSSNPTQVALAWLIARPSISAPIVSASRVEQIADLAAAGDLVLSKEQIAVLDQAST